MNYDFAAIEGKWHKYWEENDTFHTDVWDFSKPKYYVLDMFPYPSGVGLHAGHPEGYTATDIMSRMKRMQGYNVLHPMGYDSFGLPAEQYAVNTGHHPDGFTQENIKTFSKQLRELGFDYDWSKMIATSDPSFYKWTQWIFKKLYEAGYAKRIEMPVNWCEELGTVLSNDEVIDGKSERGGYPVVKKNMMQWVIDQPAFAEKLLEGLNEIDWPESTKEIQRNWIGKSTGVEVDFQLVGGGDFSIYTTCIETIYGITFMVLAPDGKIVQDLMDRIENKEEVQAYIDETVKKSDMDRTELNKGKTGCRLQGVYAINPVNGKQVPVFIGDFVLANYGTGAVMAVPSHDQRDFEYAVAHNIPMIQVIEGRDVSQCAFEKQDYLGKGCRLMNSEEFTGLTVEEAKEAITCKLEKAGVARRKVNYHFREWIFARQRYWGEPVPCVYTQDGKIYFVPDEELPVILPELEDYKGRNGQAPLENATEWKQYDHNGIKGTRETSTMPGSAGSSWYYMRYIDPQNDKEFCNQELLKHWMPVDLYVGGAEHAVLHLLYARFWHKVLYDCGVVSTKEPFHRLINQGMITSFAFQRKSKSLVAVDAVEEKDGKYYAKDDGEELERVVAKMSKSLKNVVNPDEMIKTYGADSVRMYEMFMGPLTVSKPWNTQGLVGINRFLDKIWNLSEKPMNDIDITGKLDKDLASLRKTYAKTVKKVTQDTGNLDFNVAISQMMIFLNEFSKLDKVPRKAAETFVLLLAPYAPHIAEELWEILGNKAPVSLAPWPAFDEALLKDNEVEILIQVLGRPKARIMMPAEASPDQMREIALADETVRKALGDREIIKVIAVPKRVVNIVLK